MKTKTLYFLPVAFCLASIIFIAAYASAAVELPDKLKDIPSFPNSQIVQSMDMENHAMATFKVKGAKSEAVADFFRTKMKDKGWKISVQAQQGEGEMVQFTKEGQMLQLFVKTEDDGVTYNMVMVPK